MELITAHERDRWLDVLDRVEQYDFYHLPEYHLLAEQRGEGRALLFVHRESDAVAAWPFLVRNVEQVEGLEEAGRGYKDATSVYGYPGPLYSRAAGKVDGFMGRFQDGLTAMASDMRLVSMFSRLNPVLRNSMHLEHFGSLEKRGLTVYIDLTQPYERQFQEYRVDHRRGVRKARVQGFKVYQDGRLSHLEAFAQMYEETMKRVSAEPNYFFDLAYFTGLRKALGEKLHLFVAEHEQKICSLSFFVKTGSIVQYHLSANTGGAESALGSRLIMDEARIWAGASGATCIHLGGGFRAKEDGVFEFKAGFSRCRADFYLWKMVLLPDVNRSLVLVRQSRSDHQGRLDESFFPLYRSSLIPHTTSTRPLCDFM
jgi:hypothetical protein